MLSLNFFQPEHIKDAKYTLVHTPWNDNVQHHWAGARHSFHNSGCVEGWRRIESNGATVLHSPLDLRSFAPNGFDNQPLSYVLKYNNNIDSN